jgi:subtilisin family serine protease
MKTAVLVILLQLGLFAACFADEAMVFVDQGEGMVQWPGCVQTARQIPGTGIYRVEYKGGDGCVAELQQLDPVVYVEKSTPILIPDFLGTAQTAVHTCATLANAGLLADLGYGQGVTVAVIDTGTALSVFGSDVAVNAGEIPGDGIDNDLNGYVDDVYGWNFGADNADVTDILGHGTQVTSIVLSVAPKVKIVPVKVTTGQDVAFTTGAAAEAMYYAISRGADVLNLSFSTAQFSYGIYTAVLEAVKAGVLLVAAAGNDGNTVQFPALMDEVIAVGSHDAAGNPSWFSPAGTAMGLLGLGEEACAKDLDGAGVTVSGTSFSTPAVSGTAAVLWSMNPHLSPVSLTQMLYAGTKDILDPGFDLVSGYGNLDAKVLVAVVTPGVDVPGDVKTGVKLSVSLTLPPTDAATDVYFALVFDNAVWWMDGAGIWYDAQTVPLGPFDTLVVTDFQSLPVYGISTVFGEIDTTPHLPGKYLWGTAIFDKKGNILAPIGWKEMNLYP